MKKKIICSLIGIVAIVCVFIIVMECKYSNGRVEIQSSCDVGSTSISVYGNVSKIYDVVVTLSGEISRGKLEIYVLNGVNKSDDDFEKDILEKIIIEEPGKFEKTIEIGDVSPDNMKSIRIECSDGMNEEGNIGYYETVETSKIKGWDKFFSNNDFSGLSSIGE